MRKELKRARFLELWRINKRLELGCETTDSLAWLRKRRDELQRKVCRSRHLGDPSPPLLPSGVTGDWRGTAVSLIPALLEPERGNSPSTRAAKGVANG